MTWLALLIGLIGLLFATSIKKKTVAVTIPSVVAVAPTMESKIYNAAVWCLDKEIYNLMTPDVPAEAGCAASVSYVLQRAGLVLPMGGLLTVNSLIAWMLTNGFTEDVTGSPGSVITAHSLDVNDPQFAHTGIVGKYGVMSNTSFPVGGFKSGEWGENYRGDAFQTSFRRQGCIVRYFSPPDIIPTP